MQTTLSLPEILRSFRVVARFTFSWQPGNEAYTTTIVFCSS